MQDKPSDPNFYVQKILELFRLENIKKADGTPDCNKVEDMLAKIKDHLRSESLKSQNKQAPQVDIWKLFNP